MSPSMHHIKNACYREIGKNYTTPSLETRL
jgi:hypothetical protein